MGHSTVLMFMAVFFALFVEAEANPFQYNYERLRIAGLIFSGLLFVGGIGFILYNRCADRNKKQEEDNSEI